MRFEGILDTDTFVLYLQGDKKPSEVFESVLKEALSKGRSFLVPFMTVVELVYILEKVFKLSRSEVRELVEGIFALPVEVEERDLIFEALDLYSSRDLSFGDALLIAKSRSRGALPVFTFSRKLRGMREVKVLEGAGR